MHIVGASTRQPPPEVCNVAVANVTVRVETDLGGESGCQQPEAVLWAVHNVPANGEQVGTGDLVPQETQLAAGNNISNDPPDSDRAL